MALERRLARKTDGLIFESTFAADAYRAGVGTPACPARVIPNGLLPEEFTAVVPAADAADVVFIGELRRLKGVDVLIDALSLVSARRPVTAVIVGDGPDAMTFRHQAQTLGLVELRSLPRCHAGTPRRSNWATSSPFPRARKAFPTSCSRPPQHGSR